MRPPGYRTTRLRDRASGSIAALALTSSCLPAADTTYQFTRGDWILTIHDSGWIGSLHDRKGDKLDRLGGIGDLSVRYTIKLTVLAAQVLLQRNVTVAPTHAPFTKDFGVRMGINLHPESPFEVFAPGADGVGEQVTDPLGRTWTYQLGGPALVGNQVDHLAIPLVSLADAQDTVRVTHVADPCFTTAYHFERNAGGSSTVASYLTYLREGHKAPAPGHTCPAHARLNGAPRVSLYGSAPSPPHPRRTARPPNSAG